MNNGEPENRWNATGTPVACLIMARRDGCLCPYRSSLTVVAKPRQHRGLRFFRSSVEDGRAWRRFGPQAQSLEFLRELKRPCGRRGPAEFVPLLHSAYVHRAGFYL